MREKIGLSLACIFLWACPAWAVEALSTAELALHCEKYHHDDAEEDKIFCTRYVQGFIDGAIATDERVMRNVALEYEEIETFSQRAKRTRIGSRLERFGPTAYAEYCLGDPVPLKEVVEHVVEDMQNHELVDSYPLARGLVYKTLRTHYSCDEQ